MIALRKKWQQLRERFDSRARRERAMLAAMVVGGVLLLGFSLLVDPYLVRARVEKRTAAQAQQDIAVAREQIKIAQAQLQSDPDAAAKARVLALKQELVAADASLKQLEGGLVSPEEMNALLERMLARHASLRLISFKSLVPVNIAEQAATAAASVSDKDAKSTSGTAGFGLYRHGVELKLEGSYSELHAWLAQLEKSPQKLLWGDIRFAVVEHPKSVLTVTVFTLSLERAWLAI